MVKQMRTCHARFTRTNTVRAIQQDTEQRPWEGKESMGETEATGESGVVGEASRRRLTVLQGDFSVSRYEEVAL